MMCKNTKNNVKDVKKQKQKNPEKTKTKHTTFNPQATKLLTTWEHILYGSVQVCGVSLTCDEIF